MKILMLKGLPGSGKSTWAIITCRNNEDKTVQILKQDGEWQDANGAIMLETHHYHKLPSEHY